jgi:hypothetical protein
VQALRGEEGIRTLDTLAGTAVFQAAALSHSATSADALRKERFSTSGLQFLFYTGAVVPKSATHLHGVAFIQSAREDGNT